MKLFVNVFSEVLKILGLSTVIVGGVLATYYVGYVFGYQRGVEESRLALSEILTQNQMQVSSDVPGFAPTPTPQVIIREVPQTYVPNWSGPELWEAVNKRRLELGVNAMSNQAELCTVASIRLNELLELGKLDGHEGFSNLPERRPDLEWIFDKYNVSEFLVSGAQSAEGAVSLWENTLGHKKLLTGGEYVWGCTYAQDTFGVAIAAY